MTHVGVELSAVDLAVVVPTRDRWHILERTLHGLRQQTVPGFEIVVVVDGTDQDPPPLGEVTVVVVPHGGPGAARNAGALATSRQLLLFLGDDMVPDPRLVETHLARHRAEPAPEVAVLGHAEWHPEVADGALQHWLDWSGLQFEYASITDGEAGFGHFYSCNVSLKRQFFLDAGGFDEAFTYYYEDLDCGWRLHQHGMRLRYEPAARTAHLHRYDRASLERRFFGVARGERMMAAKHEWFRPYFLEKFRGAAGAGPSPLWTRVAELVPAGAGGLTTTVRRRANDAYLGQFAPAFLAGWAGDTDLEELTTYLGADFDEARLHAHQHEVDAEHDDAPDEHTFYRTSTAYLYDLTAFAMAGTKAPYLAELRAILPSPARLLDYGCGIGSDGLRLMADGYAVAFADFDNPSTRYLRWRLERRGVVAPVYDVEADSIPSGFDLVYCFDVIEHVEDPFDFLHGLEHLGELVAVNLLDPDPDDTHLHKPLPVDDILDHAARHGLVRYRLYHGRSHFLVYRSPQAAGARRSWRSTLERRLGRHLPGRAPWFPVPGP